MIAGAIGFNVFQRSRRRDPHGAYWRAISN